MSTVLRHAFVALLVALAFGAPASAAGEETTLGVNFHVGGQRHQHKIFLDVSSLVREFAEYQGFTPDDQRDYRFRSMVQLKL